MPLESSGVLGCDLFDNYRQFTQLIRTKLGLLGRSRFVRLETARSKLFAGSELIGRSRTRKELQTETTRRPKEANLRRTLGNLRERKGMMNWIEIVSLSLVLLMCFCMLANGKFTLRRTLWKRNCLLDRNWTPDEDGC